MENKVLQENLDLIKKYDSDLACKILMFENEKSNLKISQTQQGEYNLVYKGFCLHSQQGAVLEAKQIASKIQEEKNSIKVVYGLGLGYVVEELSNIIKNSKIIVYEPEIEIVKYVLSIAKIDSLYKNNVFLCCDKKKLSDYVIQNTDENSTMKLIYTKTYKELFQDDIIQTKQLIQKAQGQHSANINTIIKKAPNALLNTYSNLDKIINLPYIMQYKDIFKDKTALIVSSGPSLKDNIEKIKNNRDKFIIFCVNTAMEYLINSDIKPDFIVDIETDGRNYHYKNLDLSDSYLILEAYSNYNKYDVKAKGIITYISQNNFLNGWLRQCFQINDNLETMGTVSYTALNSAYIMGFKKIILIGQDLAFKNGQCYAKGSIYEDLECIFDKEQNKYIIKARDFEKYTLKLMGSNTELAFKNTQKYIDNLNENIFTVKSQDGSYLPTQTGYALFVEWFERAAIEYKKEKPDIELINSSLGGAQIDGFENVDLEQAVENDLKIERIELEKHKIEFDKELCLKEIKEHIEGINEYKKYALDLKLTCEKFFKELEIKKVLTQNALKLMKKHNDALDNMLNYNKNQSWCLFMVVFAYKIIPLIEKDFSKDIKTIKETYEKLYAIYDEIIKKTNSYCLKLTNCQSVILE